MSPGWTWSWHDVGLALAAAMVGAQLGVTLRWLLEVWGSGTDDEAVPGLVVAKNHQVGGMSADDVLCHPIDAELTVGPRILPSESPEAVTADPVDPGRLVRLRGRHFGPITG
jgi:hypothetical protein